MKKTIEASTLESLDLPIWQGIILMKALEFKFIVEIDIELALEALKPFNSEDDFYYACADNEDDLVISLVNASQI
ncbi:MAG: hypothetical protein WCW84_07915 [Sulfurimonas sp.]|jgi:hypothetical protein